MTGPEHYRIAEELLGEPQEDTDAADAMVYIAAAQVHATLALAAATALQTAGVYIHAADTAEWTVAVLGRGEGSDD